MNMLEYLEKDRPALEESLQREKEGAQVARVLEQELDQLLLRHNEDCGSPGEREAAASLLRVLRLAMPLVDTVGQTQVWERPAVQSSSPAAQKSGRGKGWKLWMAAGGICLAAVLCLGGGILFPAMRAAGGSVSAGMPVLFLCFLAGSLFCLYRAGSQAHPDTGKELRVEVQTDGKKALRQLRTALLGVDQSLEELRSSEVRKQAEETEQALDGVDPAAWDLFAGLLEASYSRDGAYALDQLKQVRHYLHRQGVELVDCTENNRQMFDIMPSAESRTLRPALVQNGKLLKKGLAAEAVR